MPREIARNSRRLFVSSCIVIYMGTVNDAITKIAGLPVIKLASWTSTPRPRFNEP